MGRSWYINGETMVSVKATGLSLSQLGLSTGPIHVSERYSYRDLTVNAWGDQVATDMQQMLMDAMVTMNLIHFDKDILDYCKRAAAAGSAAAGTLSRAGTPMGNGAARFAAGYYFVGVNLISGRGALPWRFLHCHLAGAPPEFPLGAERSVISLTWRAIPYSQDPWNGGLGSYGVSVYDNVQDS